MNHHNRKKTKKVLNGHKEAGAQDSFEDAFDISNNVIDPDMLLNANKLLEKFMLRRLKEQVEKEKKFT